MCWCWGQTDGYVDLDYQKQVKHVYVVATYKYCCCTSMIQHIQ